MNSVHHTFMQIQNCLELGGTLLCPPQLHETFPHTPPAVCKHLHTLHSCEFHEVKPCSFMYYLLVKTHFHIWLLCGYFVTKNL